MTKLNRRTALASIASLPLTVPAVAPASSPDPVYMAIERHRRADAAVSALENDENIDAMVDLVNDAAWDLLVTAPTTLAGALALVRYVRLEDEQLFHYFMGIGDDGQERIRNRQRLARQLLPRALRRSQSVEAFKLYRHPRPEIYRPATSNRGTGFWQNFGRARNGRTHVCPAHPRHCGATDPAIGSWCPFLGQPLITQIFEPRFGGAHFLGRAFLVSGAVAARPVRKASAP